MKYRFLLLALFVSARVFAQHVALPHGTVFGSKPAAVMVIKATNLEAYMAKKARVSVNIRGRIIDVKKTKGGWFDIDGGHGRIIAAHFRDYRVNIPKALKGKTIIAEGVAAKQFLADDLQHFAGDTVSGKKQHKVKVNPKRRLDFEVAGLMVE